MPKIKGLKDIRTHGSLSRAEKLVGVAKDWRKIRGADIQNNQSTWNGEVECYKSAKKLARRPTEIPLPARRIKNEILNRLSEALAEIAGFAEEGIPGAQQEMKRLKEKIAELK